MNRGQKKCGKGSELLHIYRKTASVADLFANTVRPFLYPSKHMLVFLVFSLLPYSLSCPTPQLLKPLLELLVFLFLLFVYSPLPFGIESFGRAPFFPCKILDLAPEEQHHVRES